MGTGISEWKKANEFRKITGGYTHFKIKNMPLKDFQKLGESGNANFLRGNEQDAKLVFKTRVANGKNITENISYYKDGTIKGTYYIGYDKFGNKIVYRPFSSTDGSYPTLDLYRAGRREVIKEIKFKE